MADDACMTSSNLLDSHVHVREYDIHLKPNFDTFRFEGVSKIALDITDSTKVINLHAKELAISAGVTLECPSNGKTYNSESIAVSEKNTTCTFCFAEELPVGPAVLTVDFVGTLNDQMAGLYRSAYVDQYGKPKHLLCTQMEAIDARRAFPCIDEPSAKAVFRITVTTEAHRQVISNMPEASRALFAAEHSGSLMQRVTFMASPLMSPYLMALVVGEFEFLQSSTQRGTLVRVLATPGRKDQCHFALDVATRVLEWYEKFFGLPYPLPKLDLVAIPDFACGAMENWGLMGRLTMMREKSETINVGNGKWVLLNYGAWVPYRVHYSSPEMRVALAEAVADHSLPVPDRIQLLATVRALAKARHLTVCEALQLLTYYKNEDDADVWDAIAIAVFALDTICIGVGRGKEMNRLVSDLIEGPLARVGWDSKPTDESKTRQLRSTLVRLASKYCHTNTQMVDTACQRAQAYLEDPASLPADIRSSVLKLALAGGGDFWTALRERAERYDITKTEVVDIYSSLGYVRDRRLKQRTLEWSLDPVVRPSDYYTVMASVRTSSSEGADMAWDFLVTRFDDVKGRVSTACSSLLTSVFYSCAGGSTDSSRADILEHLRVEKKLNAIGRSLSQLIESIRSNAAAVEHARESDVTKDAFWSELFAMLRN
ncbi:puromycin-sensitive aminopeptidase, putative [Perkinsus marinus ATCC 50983]|uniref:Puromycin-sensitive aminopeptidase, putative n=1 Tax=Perkinsus marinus (strain ATCC 50983 / TXsc) TaxID=423536 RepID=C5LD98_PERM5|nr:puromycin-sensitive aminopeptidase, putative [Perkinsus marinus ATCC 50983]EER05230.1 puromycin-sensitive aminopeptidase, putative [Perkinsus marinus ATCC 50983]|eukprot:XP_002773414.1 puromycin-sensitive aminopeptidase, putative [Perkinsus marinus ATCC 50983]